MASKRKLEIAAWSGHPGQVTSRARTLRRAYSPWAVGLIGTVLLHALVLQSALLGSRVHKIRAPEVQGPGATLIKSDAVPAETLILIELPKIVKSDQETQEELASAGASRQETPVRLISPDPLPRLALGTVTLNDDQDAETAVDSGEGAERARLFGIYSNQTQARIERIWRRPRTAVNEGDNPADAGGADEAFRCQVRILQDKSGNVQEVLLPNCNGSAAWQRSLVIAIQQASPLPAPPSPTVFSNAMTLTFVGYAYVAGRSEDEYELAPRNSAPAMSSEGLRVSAVPGSWPTPAMVPVPSMKQVQATSGSP